MDKSLINDDVTTFVKYARAFCSLVEDSSKYESTEYAGKSLEALSGLYNAALRLPLPEGTSDTLPPKVVTSEQTAKICSEVNKQFGKYEFYQEIDPYRESVEICGSTLGLDFAEIYAEIKNSLVLFDKGEQQNMIDAVWQWKNDFMCHWGFHNLSALKAIHSYCF